MPLHLTVKDRQSHQRVGSGYESLNDSIGKGSEKLSDLTLCFKEANDLSLKKNSLKIFILFLERGERR